MVEKLRNLLLNSDKIRKYFQSSHFSPDSFEILQADLQQESNSQTGSYGLVFVQKVGEIFAYTQKARHTSSA